MTDFLQALSTLNAADLAFLAPGENTKPAKPRRRPRASKTSKDIVDTDEALLGMKVDDTPQPIEESAPAPNTENETITDVSEEGTTIPLKSPPEHIYGEHKLPVFVPPKRIRPPHEWPAVGTMLVADYFGTSYHAEVVVAKKRLKSGKQLRLLDGPSKGKRLDSFSKAMMVATAKQHRTEKRGRQGVANGWEFWKETTQIPGA